jgi:hypothetical protein
MDLSDWWNDCQDFRHLNFVCILAPDRVVTSHNCQDSCGESKHCPEAKDEVPHRIQPSLYFGDRCVAVQITMISEQHGSHFFPE